MEPEALRRQGLVRCAELAHQVLLCLEKPDRGAYQSERTLRLFLAADNIAFSSADLAPALDLLAGAGLLVRGGGGLGQPRISPGWLMRPLSSLLRSVWPG